MPCQLLSSEEEVVSSGYGYTEAKENTFNYMWTIQNFEDCLSIPPLASPDGSFGGKINNLLWILEFQTITQNAVKNLHLILLLFEGKKRVYAKVKVSILKNNGEKKNIFENKQVYLFQPGDDRLEIMNCNYNEFCKEENGNLSYGTLNLFCEVTDFDIVEKSGRFCPVKVPECCLSKDLENLFEIRKFCDITFLVDGREFKAHKNILSVRSPVFSTMFDHEFAESNQNCFTITDVDQEVFEELLRFMYTGQTKKIEIMADKLLIAADMYALERLKVICEEVLSYKISIDNVCDFIVLADKHSANQLKVQTMEFLKNNFANVKNTVGWKNAKDSDLLLLMAILENIKDISLV